MAAAFTALTSSRRWIHGPGSGIETLFCSMANDKELPASPPRWDGARLALVLPWARSRTTRGDGRRTGADRVGWTGGARASECFSSLSLHEGDAGCGEGRPQALTGRGGAGGRASSWTTADRTASTPSFSLSSFRREIAGSAMNPSQEGHPLRSATSDLS